MAIPNPTKDDPKNKGDLNLFINSRTTGKFRAEEENGRSHIVTELVAIVGDSVMKGIFHPDDAVTNDMFQFDMMAAPVGHPQVKGFNTSISNPLAANTHSIGGFIRHPRKVGKKVVCDFWLDEELANASDQGKAVISKIKKGEKVGVSAGGRGKTHPESGVVDGKAYSRVYEFAIWDHVAILLNEQAAGDYAGTQLLNNDGEDVMVYALEIPGVDKPAEKINSFNEMFEAFQEAAKETFSEAAEWVHVQDILLAENAIIISATPKGGTEAMLLKVPFTIDENQKIILGDNIKKVVRKETFEEVTNSENPFEPGENEMEKITNESATKHLESGGFKVVEAKAVEGLEEFQNQKLSFDAWKKAESDRIDGKRLEVLKNCKDLTAADMEDMSEKVLDIWLASNGSTEMNNSLRNGGSLENDNGDGKITMNDLDEITDPKGDT